MNHTQKKKKKKKKKKPRNIVSLLNKYLFVGSEFVIVCGTNG